MGVLTQLNYVQLVESARRKNSLCRFPHGVPFSSLFCFLRLPARVFSGVLTSLSFPVKELLPLVQKSKVTAKNPVKKTFRDLNYYTPGAQRYPQLLPKYKSLYTGLPRVLHDLPQLCKNSAQNGVRKKTYPHSGRKRPFFQKFLKNTPGKNGLFFSKIPVPTPAVGRVHRTTLYHPAPPIPAPAAGSGPGVCAAAYLCCHRTFLIIT